MDGVVEQMNSDPEMPDDLVPIAEAARTVGMSRIGVYLWIKRGLVRAQYREGRIYISLSAALSRVHPDPTTPGDAIPVKRAAQHVGISAATVHRWVRRGALRTWQGHRGLLICVSDVEALAAQVMLPRVDERTT